MSDQGNSGGADVVTRRDLVEQNIDKVFPNGPSEPDQTLPATIAPRPGFAVTATEMDAAKMLAMAGPLIPEFLRGNPGQLFAVIQLSKRWSQYDARTNSWITFDPVAIASQMYLVEAQGGRQNIGYSSQFVGALVDAFTSARLRFRYDGEDQERACTCYGTLASDPEPFEYTTPPLRLITPKKSPLWQSDPDRQLAYYARRAWARLFTPGVLLGVYDVEELEGRVVHRVRDINPIGAAEGLHERLAAAKRDGDPEGFHVGVVDGIGGGPDIDALAEAEEARAEAQDVPIEAPRTPTARKLRKAASKPRRGGAGRPTEKAATRKPKPAPKAAPQPVPAASKPLPTNPGQYAMHVKMWLPTLGTEEAIEERWRTERKLRNSCGIVEEQRQKIRLLVDARIAETRS